MNRRKFVKVAGLAAASTAISAPVIAQSAPALKWRPAAVSGSFANTETQNLSTSISPAPGPPWLAAVDTLISALKTAGVWANLDLFYCFTAPNADACTWNWVNTATGRLTAHGSITCDPNQFTASDGSSGYYSSSYSVNSGHAVDGNAHFGHFCLSEDTTDAVAPFQCSGGKTFLTHQSLGSGGVANMAARLNTSTSASFSSQWGSTVGHFVVQQNTTTQLEMYLDGTSYGTSSQTHSADSGTISILGNGTLFTNRKMAFVHYGAKLTATQHLNLAKALYTFLTTMDVRPKQGYLGGSTGPTNIAPYKYWSTHCVPSSIICPFTTSLTNYGAGFQGKQNAFPYPCIKVNDPNYLNIIRFELHPGDVQQGTTGDRAQVNVDTLNIPFPSDLDWAFSFLIEPGSTYAIDDNNFFDMQLVHDQTSGVNCGPTHFLTSTGRFGTWLYVNGVHINIWPTTQWGPTIVQGTWYHVRTVCRFDTAAGGGFAQTWCNGTLIFNYSGDLGNTAGAAPFWINVPIYRSAGSPGNCGIWYANTEFAVGSRTAFASRISSPVPCPPL
jgi:hypothetical protein